MRHSVPGIGDTSGLLPLDYSFNRSTDGPVTDGMEMHVHPVLVGKLDSFGNAVGIGEALLSKIGGIVVIRFKKPGKGTRQQERIKLISSLSSVI